MKKLQKNDEKNPKFNYVRDMATKKNRSLNDSHFKKEEEQYE